MDTEAFKSLCCASKSNLIYLSTSLYSYIQYIHKLLVRKSSAVDSGTQPIHIADNLNKHNNRMKPSGFEFEMNRLAASDSIEIPQVCIKRQ